MSEICHTRKKEKIARSRTWNLSSVCPTSRWAQIFRNFGHNLESYVSSWVWNQAGGKKVRRLEAAVRKQHPGQTRRWFAEKKLTLVIYPFAPTGGSTSAKATRIRSSIVCLMGSASYRVRGSSLGEPKTLLPFLIEFMTRSGAFTKLDVPFSLNLILPPERPKKPP